MALDPGQLVMPLTASLSSRARVAVNAVGLSLLVFTACVVLTGLHVFGGGAVAEFIDDWAYNIAECVAAVLVLARARVIRAERTAWLTLGIGIAMFAAADLYYTLVLEPMGNPPSPSPADAGYLLFYVGAYAMIATLVRA